MNEIQLSFNKNHIDGKIALPSSKSLSNRAIIIKKIMGSELSIENLSDSDDTQGLISIINQSETTIDVGLAGTSFRFMLAYLATQDGEFVLKGSQRIHERPISDLVEALNSIGASISYIGNEGYAPLKIVGRKLKGGVVKIKADISSQFISALALIGPTCESGLEIQLAGKVVSRPYIGMTLKMIQHFGIETQIMGNTIHIPNGKYKDCPYRVEADWSSASFWYGLVAAGGCSSVFLENLSITSWQGDKVCADLYKPLGVESIEQGDGILIKCGQADITSFECDLTDSPDLFPPLAYTVACLGIQAQISGLYNLHLKESNRLEAVKTELENRGINCYSNNNKMTIHGKMGKVTSGHFHTYGDHRMAMAAAIFLPRINNITIEDPAVVSKSYPNFWTQLDSLGIANIY